MDSGIAALLGALIGGAAAIFSNIGLERYRWYREARAVAAVLAAEIKSILDLTATRDYATLYTSFLPDLDAGIDVPMPDPLSGYPDLDPIFDRYLDKIGTLPGDLPERVALFYSSLNGIRYDLKDLGKGKHDGRPDAKAYIIREDLTLWGTTATLGQQLVIDLRKASRPWYCRLFPRLCRK